VSCSVHLLSTLCAHCGVCCNRRFAAGCLLTCRSSSGRLLNEDGTVIDEGEAGDDDDDGDGLNVAAAAAKIGRR